MIPALGRLKQEALTFRPACTTAGDLISVNNNKTMRTQPPPLTLDNKDSMLEEQKKHKSAIVTEYRGKTF